jgi:hypothetical protein
MVLLSRTGRLLLAFLMLWASTALAEGPTVSEYQVKAAFLYNFIKFIEWPDKAFSLPADPIVVGLLGDDPFGTVLDETLAGKSVQGRPLKVVRFPKLAAVERCHVLFVADSDPDHINAVVEREGRSPVLTVGELPGFIDLGGMIGFDVEARRVRFDVNLKALRAAGLKPSSQLLKVARSVHNGSGEVTP